MTDASIVVARLGNADHLVLLFHGVGASAADGTCADGGAVGLAPNGEAGQGCVHGLSQR